MLTGTADISSLVARLGPPTIPAWDPEPVELRGVDCLQLVAELRRPAREVTLPRGLHPTEPPALLIQAWKVDESVWGPFSICFTRLSCRSGVRARGFTTGCVIDNDVAGAQLATRWGFPARDGPVRLRTHYDACELEVTIDGRSILTIAGIDPQALSTGSLQYTASLNLAETPNGLRLVQVEAAHDAERVQRVGGRITRFDAASWGDDRLEPYHVVATSLARDRTVRLAPIRFACLPEVSAFEGTEVIETNRGNHE